MSFDNKKEIFTNGSFWPKVFEDSKNRTHVQKKLILEQWKKGLFYGVPIRYLWKLFTIPTVKKELTKSLYFPECVENLVISYLSPNEKPLKDDGAYCIALTYKNVKKDDGPYCILPMKM